MDGYKTIIGAFVVFLNEVCRLAGFDLGDTEGVTQSVVTLGGALLAIYGRVVATKKFGGGELK